MVSAPKEITFIKIYRSSKFSIHKISNTKHLSYTLRRGCLKTLAKLAHIMSSRLMPFWATYYTFITSSKSYLVQPFWPVTENGRFWVQKNGTWDAQIQKRRPLFVANYPQKWWTDLDFENCPDIGAVTWSKICLSIFTFPTFGFFTPP